MHARAPSFGGRASSADAAEVAQAAALLEVSEFQLFRIAWRKWHGGEIGRSQLQRYYLPYERTGHVPVWVYRLARRIIDEADAQRLDPARYVTPKPQDVQRRGPRYRLWIAVVTGMLLTGAAAIAHLAP